MLTPTELLEIVDTMQPLLDELKNWITRDIIRRMMARFKRDEDFTLTGTDEWQIEVYKAAGGHYEALQREIQRFTKKSDREVKEIFEDIGVRAWEGDNAFYANYGFESVSLFESENMLRLLEDTYKRTNGEIHNLTRTTAEMSQQKLIKALDTAHFKVMSGAQSYTQAVKDAVNEIIDTQATVRYPSGHIDTIETAILRAVRTGTGQASGNITMQGLIDRDWDLIRVSAHLGARYGDGGQNPSNHFWWQGKLYSRTGRTKEYPLFEEATGYGTGEGLCGWNCRHSFGPGDPNHNPYKDFDEEENKKAYDLSQKQRRAESRIRKTKSKLIGLREAVDNAQDEKVKETLQEEYNKEAAKLTKYNAQYDKFCKDNNLRKLNDRISVAKWNRSEAAKARKISNKSGDKKNDNYAAHNFGIGEINFNDVYFDERADYSVNIPTLDKKINAALSNACADVARNGSNSRREHLNLVDLESGKIVYKEVGERDSVGNSGYYKYITNNPDKHLAFVHNHNTETPLSSGDMQSFVSTKNLDMMISVTNNGLKCVVYGNKICGDYLYRYYSEKIAQLTQDINSGKIKTKNISNEIEKFIVEKAIEEFANLGAWRFDGRV